MNCVELFWSINITAGKFFARSLSPSICGTTPFMMQYPIIAEACQGQWAPVTPDPTANLSVPTS